jgi:acetyl-CoA C-acetyltransferase
VTPAPDRTPVVLATGQSVDRAAALTPLELAEQACRSALDQAPGAARLVERLSLVNVLGRRAGRAPASDLAKMLGLEPRLAETTVIGGNIPQSLTTRAAADIAAGRLSLTLIAGAEAVRGTRLKPQGEVAERGRSQAVRRPAAQAEVEPDPDPVFGVERQDLSDEERAAGLLIPVFVYPLFESVLAARKGRSSAGQRRHIGRLLAPFTEVAASNPYAWFRDRLTAEEISEPTEDNRLVADPYTKRMTAFLGSAQGSALLVTSLEAARAIAPDREPVFIWGGADAEETWYPVSRPDLGAAPALGRAARQLLGELDLSVDDLGLFDLYSCFPSAVQIAATELGIATDDDRGLTVTGGLPYFGGPGSNYVGHSIATMVERLRAAGDRRARGLVTGVGWYLTKHSVGVYATEPPPDGTGFRAVDTGPPAAEAVAVTAEVQQITPAEVEAATAVHDRSGAPVSVPVISRLPDGTRVAAAARPGDETQAAAEAVAAGRMVGAHIDIHPGAPPTYSIR